MSDILIHIGYHKTGTTWLQQELFTLKSEVFIPISKSDKGHSSLARDFVWSKDGYLLNSFDTNEQNIREGLCKLLKNENPKDKILVMSHERLSGSPHSSGFDSSIISKRIQKSFPNSKILIIIREQTSWILSNYFQYLSMGGTHTLKKYLNTKYDGKRPGFSPNHLEYHHLIKDYQKRFGEKNVLVLTYEMFNSDKKVFIKKLSDFVEKEIYLNPRQFNTKHNAKNDNYVIYKTRWLNNFITSSSLNNHSNRKNTVNSKLAIYSRKFLSKFILKNRNKLIKNKFMAEIDEWTNNRFNKSNGITQTLIKISLEDFGYKTNIKK
jgi:hypothetical protein